MTAKLLWQTAPNLIGEVSLGEEGRIRFTTADPFVEGNAVVAACDADGAILWSWHLWLTSADLEGSLHRYALPYEGLGAAAVMDRNLGALAAAWLGADNASSYGMFYQWGRKDPFVPFRSSQERMAVYDAPNLRMIRRLRRRSMPLRAGTWPTGNGWVQPLRWRLRCVIR